MLIIGIILLAIAAFIGAYGSLLLKKGANKLKFNLKKIIKNKELILGVFLYAVSNLFFVPGLRFGKFSVLYPVVSLSYVFSMLLAVKYLNEKMNKWKYLAIVLIIMGVVLVSLE